MRETNDTIRRLLNLATDLDRACAQLLGAHRGLTHDEVRILLELDASQESLRPGTLAKRLRLQPSAVSRILRRLEERGCIERLRVIDDARSVALHLTENGNAVANDVSTQLEAYFTGFSQCTGLASSDDLTSLLSSIVTYTLDFQNARLDD